MSLGEYARVMKIHRMSAIATGLGVGFYKKLLGMEETDFCAFHAAGDTVDMECNMALTGKAGSDFNEIYARGVATMRQLLARYGVTEDELKDDNLVTLASDENMFATLAEVASDPQFGKAAMGMLALGSAESKQRTYDEYGRRVARDN